MGNPYGKFGEIRRGNMQERTNVASECWIHSKLIM